MDLTLVITVIPLNVNEPALQLKMQFIPQNIGARPNDQLCTGDPLQM